MSEKKTLTQEIEEKIEVLLQSNSMSEEEKILLLRKALQIAENDKEEIFQQ
jgi:hypothetical protein